MQKKFLARLDKENFLFLQNLKNKYGTSMNKTMNIILKSIQDENVLLNDNKNVKISKRIETKEIRIKLTDHEYELIKNRAKSTGHKSVTKETKHILLDSILNKNIPNKNEITDLIKTRSEVNIIGRNLNQVLKRINQTNGNLKIEEKEFKNFIDNLFQKINSIATNIEYIITNSKV